MKKILVCCLILVLLVSTVSGSPLIYKTEKRIETEKEKFVEIGTFDSTKYNSIRVGVLVSGLPNEAWSKIKIEAVEGSDYILIDYIDLNYRRVSASVAVSVPSGKIRILADATGTYKIFVWASM